MGKIKGLKCRECGARYPIQPTHVCELCFGPLDVEYDYEYIRKHISREKIEQGPASMWRYKDILPIEDDDEIITLSEGFTPLIHAKRLGAVLGLDNLYLKNDTVNPTNSFKDRVVSVASSFAKAHGFETIACASTGNLAHAVAAYAAHSGLEGCVFIPYDLEATKVAAISVFAPRIYAVRGNYDDVNRLCTELADTYPWGFVNINLRPYYSEGSKTLTFETVEQLGWRIPDEIVIPVASGCQFVKHRRAIEELKLLGLVDDDKVPRFTGAQALGCAPVYNAFQEGTDLIKPVKPNTIAKSIAIGNPSDGTYVCRIARDTKGVIEAATEEEIIEGIELLAKTEGIFTETAGGVTVAVLKKLAQAERWKRDEIVVAYVTGHGFKTMDYLTDKKASIVEIDASFENFTKQFPP